ncbi:hypothetical protein [Maridesulfovibrio sp.]|uniref:hypothetical protein n=1 Tax=Maridesulfovibrio sp. TaxID=2795000 RepID=UPI0039EF9867
MSNISILNAKYKLDSLGLLPDFCLQEIFNREVSNASVAKIIILLSEDSKKKVLQNINKIRVKKINIIIDKFYKKTINIPFTRFEKSCEDLLERVQELKEDGRIRIPEVIFDESFLNSAHELDNFSDNLPRFNCYHNDLHDLISWWNLAAKNIKSLFGKRVQAENLILERLEDEFSSNIFAYAIDALNKNEFADKAEEMRSAALRDFELRLNLIKEFLMSLITKTSKRDLATRLASYFDNDEIQNQLIKNGPLLLLPAIKDKLPAEDIAMSLYKLKLMYDESGFEEIVKHTTPSNSYFLVKGLSISSTITNQKYAEKIIVERKKSIFEDFKIKQKMIIDAATCIRENISSYVMLELMASYTVYDFEE